jgi:phosphopantetheinyl transferase
VDALGLWCAKEAAAKALGQGLNGRPHAFAVQPDTAGASALVSHEGHRVSVRLRRHRGWVLAAADG